MTSRPPKRTPRSAKPAAGIDPQSYATFVIDLKLKIVEARHRASLSVNRELILLS
ncbi:hypothetical protein [Mesorhizobium loti]|uniref:hypothetical protein n=1 Tax=Rhizobium loti TaxID=381 RepID=UPI000AB71771|nr:hypothetical protein [Mesorhizobium loti]